ncbi:hypothetical protein [Ralstonia solanacearum]|uniref:hypothetical protein n=1 Tax=Ralstonia solanacearum TaxID=305 RepID=UPI0012FE5C80|nr:hypothetical protein [Ralstonia solanacearum]
MRTLIFVSMLVLSINSAVAEPIWITAACIQLRMSAWDKLDSQAEYSVRYLVTTEGGSYEAKKIAKKSVPDSAEVVFPDDFHDARNGLPANINCSSGGRYYWGIYAGGRKIDSGYFDFRRARGVNK